MEKLGTVYGVNIYADMEVKGKRSQYYYDRILEACETAFNTAYPAMRDDPSSWHGRNDDFID